MPDYNSQIAADAFEDDGTDLGAGGLGIAKEPILERPAVAPARSAAAMDQQQQTAAQTRLAELNKADSPIWDKNHPEHKKAVAELRRLVAEDATEEQKGDIATASLAEHREVFGMAPPKLPKVWQEAYAAEFENHEAHFLAAARQHGLDKGLVTELRDTAVRLAVEADGKPLSNETWDALEKQFTERLTPKHFKSLKAWWQSSVEGVAA